MFFKANAQNHFVKRYKNPFYPKIDKYKLKHHNIIEKWSDVRHELQMKGKVNFTKDDAYTGA